MKTDIIGGGNVATHLYKALSGKTDVRLVAPRTLEGLRDDCDIIVLSVSDSIIEELASRIPDNGAILAHTSGSVSIDAINNRRHKGVFYPLQTFTKGIELDYSRIHFFIEGNDEHSATKLRDLALQISEHIHDADSALRKRLHVASVFACNFTNHMYTIADSLLSESGLDISMLSPLIEETVRKITKSTPFNAQTGPARRGDTAVMDSHIALLADRPAEREIYRLVSRSIFNTYTENKDKQ